MKTIQLTCSICHRIAVFDDLAFANCPYCNSPAVSIKSMERSTPACLTAWGFNNLNSEQQQACRFTEGINFVNAGPGTGKTRLLIARMLYIASLRRDNIHHPLALTFTNQAVEQIKCYLNVRPHDRPIVETLHRFAYRLLKQFASQLGDFSSFRLLNENDFSLMLTRLQTNYPDLYYDFSVGEFKKELQQRKSSAQGKYAFALMEEPAVDDEFLLHSLELQRQWRLLNFDDLIGLAVYLLHTQPHIADYVQDQYRYILVDEAQDLTEPELELLRQISDKYRNLFLVGDEDQSIYNWRGSSRNIVQWLEQHYPCVHKFQLSHSYRNSQSILSAAGTLIGNHLNRDSKILTTDNKPGVKVFVKACLTPSREAKMVADSICLSTDSSLPCPLQYSEIAVLARTHTLLKEIYKTLVRFKIPVSGYAEIPFCQKAIIKEVVSYLAFLARPDEFSFAAIKKTFIPDEHWGEFCKKKETSGESFWQALNRWSEEQRPVTAEGSAGLKMLNEAKLLFSRYGINAFEKVIALIADFLHVAPNAPELKQLCSARWSKGRSHGLIGFLDYLNLQSREENEIQTRSNHVHLMTLHAAKGKEFKKVFICGATDTILPAPKGNVEEERRLLYVGITRAKSELIISYSMQYYGHETNPSRFLKELLDSKSTIFSGIPTKTYKKR